MLVCSRLLQPPDTSQSYSDSSETAQTSEYEQCCEFAYEKKDFMMETLLWAEDGTKHGGDEETCTGKQNCQKINKKIKLSISLKTFEKASHKERLFVSCFFKAKNEEILQGIALFHSLPPFFQSTTNIWQSKGGEGCTRRSPLFLPPLIPRLPATLFPNDLTQVCPPPPPPPPHPDPRLALDRATKQKRGEGWTCL